MLTLTKMNAARVDLNTKFHWNPLRSFKD